MIAARKTGEIRIALPPEFGHKPSLGLVIGVDSEVLHHAEEAA
jgi:hypothetical protein